LAFGFVSQTAPAASQPARPALRQRAGLAGFSFVLQVIDNLLDHHRVFDAGNDPGCSSTDSARLNVDAENPAANLAM